MITRISSHLKRGVPLLSKRFFSSPEPNSSFKYPIWKSFGLLLATGTGLWAYYRNEQGKISAKRNLEKAGAVGVPLIGGSFDLTSADGAKFSNSDLLGKYYLLYFGFTHCPDICPEELVKISEITKRVKDIKADVPFVPVFITCDPERDSPDVIKSYLKDFGNDFVGLTGEPNVIKNVAKSFRIYYRKTPTSADGDYLVDHSIFFYLMGPDGKFICNFGRESSVDSCTDKILEEMKKGENKPSQ